MADEAKPTPAAPRDREKKPDGPSGAPPDAKEAPAPTPRKGLSPILLAVVALVSLVVFLGVFSYFMGVFDPPPPPTETSASTGHETDSATAQPSHYYSDFGRAAARLSVGSDSNAVDTFAALSDLERRRKEIAAEQAAMVTERQRLQTLKAEVEQLLAKKQGIASERVLYMAKLLDGMKPEELTALIEKLDNNTILAILPNMKPQNASKVLAMLPPERAAEIATQLLSPDSEPESKTDSETDPEADSGD